MLGILAANIPKLEIDICKANIFFPPPISRCGCLWFCCTRRNINVNSSEVESKDNSTVDQQVANTSNISVAKDELAYSDPQGYCVEYHTPV